MEELLELGITSRLIGYRAIVEAMRLFDEDPVYLTETVKLYQKLAERLNTEWKNVERNIRTAVEQGWKRNRPFMEKILCLKLPKPPKAGMFLGALYAYRNGNNYKL